MNIWRHWKDESNEKWGYTWCAPGKDMNELEWTLRYGSPSREQLLAAASVLSAYTVMVELPERTRRTVLREIRKGPSPRAEVISGGCPPYALRLPEGKSESEL